MFSQFDITIHSNIIRTFGQRLLDQVQLGARGRHTIGCGDELAPLSRVTLCACVIILALRLDLVLKVKGMYGFI